MGKNTIAQIALGRTPEEEYKDNLRHVSKVTFSALFCLFSCNLWVQGIEGNVGLLFTSRDKKEVKKLVVLGFLTG